MPAVPVEAVAGAGADAGADQQAAQRLDQDDQPLARARPGRPARSCATAGGRWASCRRWWTASWPTNKSASSAAAGFRSCPKRRGKTSCGGPSAWRASAAARLTEVSRRIARRLGRSPETVRYTIKNFDREHPEQALFPATDRAAGCRHQANDLYSSYRRGIAVDTLAKRFQRTRTSMYRDHQRGAGPAPAEPAAGLHLPCLLRRPGAGGGDHGADARRSRSTRPSGSKCACPRTRRRSWPRCTRCRC